MWLSDGEQAEFWWPGGPRAERSRLYSDAFGDWVLAESRLEGDASSTSYVSAEMTGVEDLDRYGSWEAASDYGPLWIPTTVVVGWAPYRYGRWAWSRVWGWTWVDDSPWGFAPFHYGRWVQWRGRWCWAPGPYVPRPVYAPALVGWVGGPPAVSVNIQIGRRPPPPRAGWYPLAPREVFVPVYRHTPGYVARVNDPRDLRDPVTVQRPHRYRDVPSAVSTLPVAGWQAPVVRPGQPPGPGRDDRRGRDEGWARPAPGVPARAEPAPGPGAAPTLPSRDPGREPPRHGGGQPLPTPGMPTAPVTPVAPAAANGAAPPSMHLPRGPSPATQSAPQPAVQGVPTAQPPQAVERPAPAWRRPDRREDSAGEDRREERRDEFRGGRRDEGRDGGRRPGGEPAFTPPPQAQPAPQPQFQPPPQPPRPSPEVVRPRPAEPPVVRPPEAVRPAPPTVQPRGEERGPVRGRPEGGPGRPARDKD
ncbi:MAG: hypothetical protein DI603_04840 [Roseateles depolymerans]|uniref:Uncharacterized protein n=1 Tax=Roseateles depolymerans TaxID=76731 RepID=A0A2W5DX28_9BURK|nr:MAG: hypothetical protein DI603_04840 [Roseateles depolymerans]